MRPTGHAWCQDIEKDLDSRVHVIPAKPVPEGSSRGAENPASKKPSGLPPEFIPAKAGAGVTIFSVLSLGGQIG